MSASSSAAVESMTRSLASARPGRAAGAEPVAMIACLKRTFCGSSPSTRSSRELSKTARPPAHDPLGLPLAQGIERDPRLAEVDAEIAGAPGVLDEGGDVQERLRRNAAFPEARAAEALGGVHDHGLEPELGAAEGGRIAAGPTAHDDDVHLDDEVAHDHGCRLLSL